MAVSNEFIDLVLEQLESLGHATARRMFGGAGLYVDGLIMGILDDDRVYFKVDDISRPAFEAEGLQPLSYAKKDGTVGVMSYYAAPEAALDDRDEFLTWARLGLEAAERAR